MHRVVINPALSRASSAASSDGGSDLTRGLSSSTDSGAPSFELEDNGGINAPTTTGSRVRLGWTERVVMTANCCLVGAAFVFLYAGSPPASDSAWSASQMLWVIEVGLLCLAVFILAVITECCGVVTAKRGSSRGSDYATCLYCGFCTGVCAVLSSITSYSQPAVVVPVCILVQTGTTGLLGLGIGSRASVHTPNTRRKAQRDVLLFANMVSCICCALVSAALAGGVMLVEHHATRLITELELAVAIVAIASVSSAAASARMLAFHGIVSQLYGWVSGSIFAAAAGYCILVPYALDTDVLHNDGVRPQLQFSVKCAAIVCGLSVFEAFLWKRFKASSWVVALAVVWISIGCVSVHFLWEAAAESRDLEALVNEQASGFLYETGACANASIATRNSVDSEALALKCAISWEVTLLELVGVCCLFIAVSSFVRGGCLLMAHSIETRARHAAHARAMQEQGRDSVMQDAAQTMGAFRTERDLAQAAREQAEAESIAMARTMQRTKIAQHVKHCLWEHAPGSQIHLQCKQLLESTWLKSDQYRFDADAEVVVHEIDNPALHQRYADYTAAMNASGEKLLFHGCSKDVITSICEDGFLAQFQTSSAGSWQRFGPGFYFALQSSKSHDYPLGEMQQQPTGAHRRCMLLCKVASGREFRTHTNRDKGEQNPPAGYDSVHGEATHHGPLNWDELVVYEEAAVLPYAVVEYGYLKIKY